MAFSHPLLHPRLLYLLMLNTFDGVIREFPHIGLDRFNLSASTFLLTHCHADHLVGLASRSFAGWIYCSLETKAILKQDTRLKNVIGHMTALPYNIPTRIEVLGKPGNAYYVSLIEAYHCVGACMFLIEEYSSEAIYGEAKPLKSVLCTGDVRAETWWQDQLVNSPPLFPYIQGLRTLDNVYFDSTFAYRGEPYIEIPPNNHGIHAAILLLKEYPLLDPEISYEFADTTLGFEQAWNTIVSYFGGTLAIPDHGLYKKILLVTDLDKRNKALLKKALTSKTTLQRCRPEFLAGKQASENFTIKIKQCIDFNILDYAGVCFPIPTDTIPQKEPIILLKTTKRGTQILRFRDRIWILPLNGKELLPQEIKLTFSRHSSFSETYNLISKFKPRQVFPISYSPKAWINGFTMKRLFDSICSDQRFLYDSMMTEKYGHPPQELLEVSVTTVNRWNVEECEQEKELVLKIVNRQLKQVLGKKSDVPSLLKLRKVLHVPYNKSLRGKDDEAFLKKRRKDFALQKLVQGRQDVSYRKFIEEQQRLYYIKYNVPHKRVSSPHSSHEKTSEILGGSSVYDSDSSGSSMDLLHMSSKKTSIASEGSEESIVEESLEKPAMGVTMFPASLAKESRSFISSSFGSFEESLGPVHRLTRTAPINSDHIESIAKVIAKRPYLWLAFDLQSVHR